MLCGIAMQDVLDGCLLAKVKRTHARSDILVSRYDLGFIFYLPGENCSSDLLESKNLEISELNLLLIVFLAKYEFKMN